MAARKALQLACQLTPEHVRNLAAAVTASTTQGQEVTTGRRWVGGSCRTRAHSEGDEGDADDEESGGPQLTGSSRYTDSTKIGLKGRAF